MSNRGTPTHLIELIVGLSANFVSLSALKNPMIAVSLRASEMLHSKVIISMFLSGDH